MGRPTTYSPTIIPAVKAAAWFGATLEEIAEYLDVSVGQFKRWVTAQPELRVALKPAKEHADARVVDSLYRQALAGNPTCIVFWLKNRDPQNWRDVQNVDAAVGHYILSDKPLTEDEWIAQRTKVIEAKPVVQSLSEAKESD